MTREGFFDYFKPSSLVFNLRMDPFERHGGQKSNDMAMKMGMAFGGQVQDAVTCAHGHVQGVQAASGRRHAAHGQLRGSGIRAYRASPRAGRGDRPAGIERHPSPGQR